MPPERLSSVSHSSNPTSSCIHSSLRVVFLLIAAVFFMAGVREAAATEWPFSVSKPSFIEQFNSAFDFSPPEQPVEKIKREMKKFLGIPYRWGGESFKGMDCSGLTKKVYASIFGIELPHNSSQQSRLDGLKEVRPTREELQLGDLLFFGPKKKRINHVGIYLSDGKFLHSCRSQGVTISSLNKAYWKNRLITSKRLKDVETTLTPETAALSLAPCPEAAPMFDPFEDAPPSFELGYRRTLLDFANLSLDTFMHITAWDRAFSPGARGSDSWYPERSSAVSSFEPRQGFRLFADFTPFEWLTITPSFTRVSGHAFLADNDGSWQSFGLETLVTMPDSRWALAMSAKADHQETAPGWLSATEEDTFDITFGLRYRYSSSINFSILGSHEPDAFRQMEAGDEDPSGSSHFTFKVDLTF